MDLSNSFDPMFLPSYYFLKISQLIEGCLFGDSKD